MDNVIDMFKNKNGSYEADTGPKLPQDDYKFVVRNDDGGYTDYMKRGHLIVTGTNIVLFNEGQELVWGIPNDSSLVYFERVEPVDEASVVG